MPHRGDKLGARHPHAAEAKHNAGNSTCDNPGPVGGGGGVWVCCAQGALYQFAGDASCPVIDLRPVAEVAVGKSRAGGRELAKRPLGEGQLARGRRTEEDVMTARVQCLSELGNLFRHCRRAQVPALGVGGSGAERTAAEQPHRPGGQDLRVTPDELRGFLAPVQLVRGAADHEGVVDGQIAASFTGRTSALQPAVRRHAAMRPAIPRVAPCMLAYTTRTGILIISASTIGHPGGSRQGPNVLCRQARSLCVPESHPWQQHRVAVSAARPGAAAFGRSAGDQKHRRQAAQPAGTRYLRAQRP